jgi:hypothetical protein
MADNIFEQLAAEQKGGAAQAAPAQPTQQDQSAAQPESSQQASAPQSGNIFDQLAAEKKTQPATADQPGLVGRAYETSGAKGIVDTLFQSKDEQQARLKQPMDLYNAAVEALDRGDLKAAAGHANKLVAYTANGFMSKDNPLYKAAEAIIMHPIEEAYEAGRAARQGNGLAAAQHGIGAVPILGGIAEQIGGDIDQDAHQKNWSGVAGDILGPLLTLWGGKMVGAVSEAVGTNLEGVRPSEVEIAGEKVPVASNSPNLASQSGASKVASQAATKGAAKAFIEDRVQPAAVKASQSNFAHSAMESADELRTLRGEPSVMQKPPALRTVHDIGEFLRDEAKGTYQKLDEAGQTAQEAWEQTYGKAARAAKVPKPTLYDANDQPIAAAPEPKIPPKPKNFSELKTAINDAEETLRPGGGDNAAQSAAKEELPGLKKQMRDFLDEHEGVVSQDELDAADKVWAKSRAYDWLSKRVRSATQGQDAGKIFAEESKSLRPSSLRNIPKQFENRYGEGAWSRFLGPDGVKNYNDVLSALETPAVGGNRLMQWLGQLKPAGLPVGDTLKLPLSALADNLLFNPEFGQTAMRLWKLAPGAPMTSRQALALGTNLSNRSAEQKRKVYSGTASSLGR